MKRNIRLLAAALAAQLLLAVGLFFTGPDLSARASNTPLLSLQKDKVDRLTIEGPEKAQVVLVKAGGTWTLPGSGNFPADGRKIGQLIERLDSLELGSPVATTAAAQERFKVADAAFERRITLSGGGKTLATVYLGTSPSMRQVHARRADQKEVYSVDFATYDVPVKTDDWQDRAVLQFPKADAEAIEVAGLKLRHLTGSAAPALGSADKLTAKPVAQKTGPDWQATGLVAGERLQPEAADQLAGLLANLRIDSVLGKDEKPAYGLAHPIVTLVVIRKGGQRIEYRLGKMADGQAYVLKASSRPEYFRLPAYSAEPLIAAAKRAALLRSNIVATRPTHNDQKQKSKG